MIDKLHITSVGSVVNGNDSERYDREKDEGDTLQQ
jgi:hypothetical protein